MNLCSLGLVAANGHRMPGRARDAFDSSTRPRYTVALASKGLMRFRIKQLRTLVECMRGNRHQPYSVADVSCPARAVHLIRHHIHARRYQPWLLWALAQHEVVVPSYRNTIDGLDGEGFAGDFPGRFACWARSNVAPERSGLAIDSHERAGASGDYRAARCRSIPQNCASSQY